MFKLNSQAYRYFIFVLGIIATISYRIIIVLNSYNPLYVQIAWYIGTVGFIWYFAHRYKSENKRNRLIVSFDLLEKIKKGVVLDRKEKEALLYVLNSLQTSLSKWNYMAIFILSSIALAYGIYFDLINLLA